MNELILQQEQFIQNLPLDLLAKIYNQKMFNQLNEQVTEIKEQIAINAVTTENQIKELKENFIKGIEKQSFIGVRALSEEFVNKTNLGKNNNPPISSQRMTKIMKYAGILQNFGGAYSRFFTGNEPLVIKHKFITPNGYEDFQELYHQKRTWNIIHNAFKRDEIYEDFLNCKTKDEVDLFIDKL